MDLQLAWTWHVGAMRMTYGQDAQKGRLASILQADHGYVHLGRPIRWSAYIQLCDSRSHEQSRLGFNVCDHPACSSYGGSGVTRRENYVPEQAQQPVIDALEEAGHI